MSDCKCEKRLNLPMYEAPVGMMQLVCTHGTSSPRTPEEHFGAAAQLVSFTASLAVLLAAESLTLSVEEDDGHLIAWLFNWGTPQEFIVCLDQENAGFEIRWNRCPEKETVEGTKAAWWFHSRLPVTRWAELNFRLAAGETLDEIYSQ